MISPQKALRGAVAVAMLLVLVTLLVACSSSPSNESWLATGSSWAFFLQLNGGSGTADYTYTIGQSINTDHAAVTVNNDSTLTFDLVHYRGGGCPDSCPYTVNANTFVLTMPGAAPLTMQPGTTSQFEAARSNIQATIAAYPQVTATAQAQSQDLLAQEQAKCEAIHGAKWIADKYSLPFSTFNNPVGMQNHCIIRYSALYDYTDYGIFFDSQGNIAPDACADAAMGIQWKSLIEYDASGGTDETYQAYLVNTCSVGTAEQAKTDCLDGKFRDSALNNVGLWHADTDICELSV